MIRSAAGIIAAFALLAASPAAAFSYIPYDDGSYGQDAYYYQDDYGMSYDPQQYAYGGYYDGGSWDTSYDTYGYGTDPASYGYGYYQQPVPSPQPYPIMQYYPQAPQYYYPQYYGSQMYPMPATQYTGTTNFFGQPMCSFPGYGAVACGTDPRQPVQDVWTGQWY